MPGPMPRTATAAGRPSPCSGAAAPLTAGARAEVARRLSALSHPRFAHPADALAWLNGSGPDVFGRVARMLLGSPSPPPVTPAVHRPVLPLDESIAETIARCGVAVGAPTVEVVNRG